MSTWKSAWAVGLVAGSALLVACVDPKPNDPTCGPRGECPDGMQCANGPGTDCKSDEELCVTRRDTAYHQCLSDPPEAAPSNAPGARIPRDCWAAAAAPVFAFCCDESRDATCATPAPPDACKARVPDLVSALPDDALNAVFRDYGNRGAGWTGGDGVYTARLPDGRLLWTFSDTFLGSVADGARPQPSPMVNQSFVLQAGDQLSTANTESLLRDSRYGQWYWAGDNFVADGAVHGVFQQFRNTGSGPLDFAHIGTARARFSLDRLQEPAEVASLPFTPGILWGAAILPADESGDGHTYIYGIEDVRIDPRPGRYMVVARVQGTDLSASWQYLTARHAWSSFVVDAAPTPAPVSSAYSVVPFRGQFLLVTQDSEFLSNQIVAYAACTPVGPFSGRTQLYVTPEAGPFGSYGNGDVYAYNARAHGELTSGNTILVSYNVNSFNFADVHRDVTIYRPRFVRVTFR